MKQDPYILNELKEIAPSLLDINRNEVYVPPVGYFHHFAMQMQQRLASNEQVQIVPQDYFNELSSNILSRIQKAAVANPSSTLEEKDVSFPLLEQLNKANPYTVPANYFEQLAINPRLENKEAKVVQMTSFRRIVTYAAAACFVGLISITAIKLLSKPAIIEPSIANACTNIDDCVAGIDDQAIQQYLKNNSTVEEMIDDVETVKPASDEELIDEIDNKDLDNLIKQLNEKPVNSTDL
jgi:hypothetical protein